MINEKAYGLGSKRSAIRELFEYGRKRVSVVGKENVCDFSLGNPSVPSPQALKEAYIRLLELPPLETHGYTSAAGCDELRAALARNVADTFDTEAYPQDFYVTCGAAAALTSVMGALTIDDNTEFIALAPFFPEYRCFAETSGAKLRVVDADEKEFQIDFEKLEKAINVNTQAVIVNSPNNPSGVVYTEFTVKRLAKLLSHRSEEYGKPIYIISDEPYRELVYGGVKVPFIPKYYPNTVVCYSYSKKLSIPGERIGYVYVPQNAADNRRLFDAVAGAARAYGYVCAPSLVQRVIAACVDVPPDLTVYETNRDILYNGLTEMGYFCAKPDGAFYLFVKTPENDGDAFCERAKQKDLLVVPGAGFGCPGFVRISYCVDTEVCLRSLPVFKELIEKNG